MEMRLQERKTARADAEAMVLRLMEAAARVGAAPAEGLAVMAATAQVQAKEVRAEMADRMEEEVVPEGMEVMPAAMAEMVVTVRRADRVATAVPVRHPMAMVVRAEMAETERPVLVEQVGTAALE